MSRASLRRAIITERSITSHSRWRHGAVIFHSQVDGWSVIDALHFSVITMATTGYGDLAPTTTRGKSFTMFCALRSVGVLVAVAARVGANLLEKEQRQVRRRADKKGGPDTGRA